MKTRGDSSKEISNIGFVNGWAEVVGTERNMYTINYNLKNVFWLHTWPHVSLSLNHMHLRYDLDVDEHRLWSVFPVLSCPGLACPLLRSAARHRVAPVECDDHGLDKAPHSWPLVPLWKFATGSLDHRVGGGQSPSTPRQPPHQPHISICCISLSL